MENQPAPPSVSTVSTQILGGGSQATRRDEKCGQEIFQDYSKGILFETLVVATQLSYLLQKTCHNRYTIERCIHSEGHGGLAVAAISGRNGTLEET